MKRAVVLARLCQQTLSLPTSMSLGRRGEKERRAWLDGWEMGSLPWRGKGKNMNHVC